MTNKKKLHKVIVAPNVDVYEDGEDELEALIKLAGEDARARKRKVMEHHFQMIQKIVEKNVAQQKNSLLK